MQKYIDFHTCPPSRWSSPIAARADMPRKHAYGGRLGYAVQADLWELDANYTKDGKLVVMHDDTSSVPPTWKRPSPAAPPIAYAISR